MAKFLHGFIILNSIPCWFVQASDKDNDGNFADDNILSELGPLHTAWLKQAPKFIPDIQELEALTLDRVMKIEFGADYVPEERNMLSTGTKDSARTRDQRNGLSQYDCIDGLGRRSCSYFLELGACNRRRRSMKKYCAKSCRFCGEPHCKYSKFGCCLDGNTAAKGPHLRGCRGDCEDTKGHRYCKIVRKIGLCLRGTNSTYMKLCTKSCGFCRPCEDDEPMHCRYSKRYGGCTYRRGEMMNTCRKSCNFCGKNDACYHHACPKRSICKVNKKGSAVCVCNRKCHKGDRYTGVICGRNGVQYDNLCHLKRSHCHNGKKITIKNYGKCVSDKDQRSNGVAAAPALNKPNPNPIKIHCTYSKFGCCLDGESDCKGEAYEGCPNYPACKDYSEIICRRFLPLCGTQRFMKWHCPRACFLCK